MLCQICAVLLDIRLCILVILTPYKSVVDMYTVFICGHHQSIESNIDLDVLIFLALFFGQFVLVISPILPLTSMDSSRLDTMLEPMWTPSVYY